MMAIWHGLLLAINVASGFLIVQHAICNLSRWTYSIRSTRRMYREFVAEPNGTLGAVMSGLRAWFGRAR